MVIESKPQIESGSPDFSITTSASHLTALRKTEEVITSIVPSAGEKILNIMKIVKSVILPTWSRCSALKGESGYGRT